VALVVGAVDGAGRKNWGGGGDYVKDKDFTFATHSGKKRNRVRDLDRVEKAMRNERLAGVQ